MKIEHNNWEPADRLCENMLQFNENIGQIRQQLNLLPDFTENMNQDEVSQANIDEKISALIRIKAKLESTISLLDVVKESYHNYQEMYFNNLS